MPDVFVPPHGIVRLSCDTCVKGHRTAECKCWDTKRQNELAQKYINEVNDFKQKAGVRPGEGTVTFFRKTNRAGRPSAEEARERKQVTEFYAVLRLPTGEMECGKLLGTMKTKKDTGEVLESCCAPQPDGLPSQPIASTSQQQLPVRSASHMENLPTSNHLSEYPTMHGTYSAVAMVPAFTEQAEYSNHSEIDLLMKANPLPAAVQQEDIYTSVVPMQLGHIKVDPSSHDSPAHKCRCGETCTCAFCPMHPNNPATRRHMGNIIQQGWQQRPLNYGEISAQYFPVNSFNARQDNATNIATCNGRFPSDHDLTITPDLNACLDQIDDDNATPSNTWFARFRVPESADTPFNFSDFSNSHSTISGVNDPHVNSCCTGNLHSNTSAMKDPQSNFHGIDNSPNMINGVNSPHTNIAGVRDNGHFKNGNSRDMDMGLYPTSLPAPYFEQFGSPQHFFTFAHDSPPTATWPDRS